MDASRGLDSSQLNANSLNAALISTYSSEPCPARWRDREIAVPVSPQHTSGGRICDSRYVSLSTLFVKHMHVILSPTCAPEHGYTSYVVELSIRDKLHAVR